MKVRTRSQLEAMRMHLGTGPSPSAEPMHQPVRCFNAEGDRYLSDPYASEFKATADKGQVTCKACRRLLEVDEAAPSA